jgi:hypothetical protein
LNDAPEWIDALQTIILEEAAGWLTQGTTVLSPAPCSE